MSTEEDQALVHRLLEESRQREANKGLVRRWVAARNANDVEAALQCWSDERQEWLRNNFGNFSRGFPDIHLEIEDLVAERDEVVMRVTLTGTHLGVWSGIEPTGAKVQWRRVDTFTIVDGKIASLLRVAPDLKAMLAGPPLSAEDLQARRNQACEAPTSAERH